MRLTVRTLLSATTILMASQLQALDWKTTLPLDVAAKLPADTRSLYDQAITHIDRVDYDGGVMLLGQAAEKSPEAVELQFFTLARARDRAEVYYSAASFAPYPEKIAYEGAEKPLETGDQKTVAGSSVPTLRTANGEVFYFNAVDFYSVPVKAAVKEKMEYGTPPWRTSELFYDIADNALRRLQENSALGAEEKRRASKEATALQDGRAGIQERDKKRFETALPLTNELYEIRKAALKLEEPEVAADRLAAKGGLETPATDKPAEDTKSSYSDVDPFAPLPGEYTQSITDLLPVPVQPGQGQFGPGMPPGGEFGDPALTASPGYFGAPPPAAAPAPAPADPAADPFGGGK